MDETGLVIEGGGMRGVYFAGVLDHFMREGLFPPYVIGVSAGACQAASYLSRQQGRGKETTIGFIGDPRYLSLRNLLMEGSLFGMRFLFDEIPNKLVPFDNDAFNASSEEFVIVTTDCHSGEPVYHRKSEGKELATLLQAACSLPFLSRPVRIGDKVMMDGGMADPIPVRKSIADGHSRNIILLSRNRGYRKTPFKYGKLARCVYPKYPGLRDCLERRPRTYNDTLDLIDDLESTGSAFVIRPTRPLVVDRLEKNPEKLLELYDQGVDDAKSCYRNLCRWC